MQSLFRFVFPHPLLISETDKSDWHGGKQVSTYLSSALVPAEFQVPDWGSARRPVLHSGGRAGPVPLWTSVSGDAVGREEAGTELT